MRARLAQLWTIVLLRLINIAVWLVFGAALGIRRLESGLRWCFYRWIQRRVKRRARRGLDPDLGDIYQFEERVFLRTHVTFYRVSLLGYWLCNYARRRASDQIAALTQQENNRRYTAVLVARPPPVELSDYLPPSGDA